MITSLQRQQVSKRPSTPARSPAQFSAVPSRVRTSGVRWSNRPLPPARLPEETYGSPGSALEALRTQVRVLRRTGGRLHAPGAPHSFLEGQVVRRAPLRARVARRASVARRARREEKQRERGAHRERAAYRHTAQKRPADRTRDLPGAQPLRASARRLIVTALRTPWLYAGLLVLALAAVASTGFGSLPLVRAPHAAVLPVPQDVDPVLYQLLVPDQESTPASPASAALLNTLKVSSYRTVGGDTLSKIAARFRLNVDTLVSWNGIKDARSVSAGTILSIPNTDGLRYAVRRGDTLQGIARSYGVDFNGILDANMLSSSVITVGQNLFIPGARLSPNELNRILGSLFLYPVQGRISSYFGERPDPFTGVPNVHNGIDIVNTPGTPILAAMAGTVRAVGFNFNYGNYVIIQHSGVYQTLYGHLTRSIVTRGQKVSQGQEIGELGTTGYSTGPHLHFSIFKNGEAVDPLRFLK